MADHLANLASILQPEDPCVYSVEDSCRRLSVDLNNSVPLACLKIVRDEQANRWTVTNLDACSHKRLVKRNDLLFDLIRGCDLTRISAISWAEWHRKLMPFSTFLRLLGQQKDDEGNSITGFTVHFSRPVRRETLCADCFAMTIIGRKCEDNEWLTVRAPIVDVVAPPETNGCVPGASIVLKRGWVNHFVEGDNSSSVFAHGKTLVEIEFRGDYVTDCNGQAVDANAAGLSSAPSGNGTPGGTFLSSFRVDEKKFEPKPPQPDINDQKTGAYL